MEPEPQAETDPNQPSTSGLSSQVDAMHASRSSSSAATSEPSLFGVGTATPRIHISLPSWSSRSSWSPTRIFNTQARSVSATTSSPNTATSTTSSTLVDFFQDPPSKYAPLV